MYKKKKVLALCLAGLCSTTTISNIYSASALAATSQSGAASETTAATTAGKSGSAASTAWGCDLTYDYVKINGDYRT